MNENVAMITEAQAQEELKKHRKQAKKIIDEQKLDEFLLQLEVKLKKFPKIGEKLSHLPVFISMVKSYAQKKYTKIPAGTLIAIVSALLYLIVPVDVVPDFIPGAGMIDDALVLSICATMVESDIQDFIKWRDAQPTPVQ